jgi:hypothetical protein
MEGAELSFLPLIVITITVPPYVTDSPHLSKAQGNPAVLDKGLEERVGHSRALEKPRPKTSNEN